MKKVIQNNMNHGELVDRTKHMLQDSEYEWNVVEPYSNVGPDLLASSDIYHPNIRFAIVCASGKISSSLRKMNIFENTNYSWIYSPLDLQDHRARRRFMLRLGVGYFNTFANTKRTITLNYNDNDAKLPVEHDYSPEDRFDGKFESVDIIPYIEKQLERYDNNTKAWRSGNEPDPSNFNL